MKFAIFASHLAETQVGIVQSGEEFTGSGEYIGELTEETFFVFGEDVSFFPEEFFDAALIEGKFGRVEQLLHSLVWDSHDFGFKPCFESGKFGELGANAIDAGAVNADGGIFV